MYDQVDRKDPAVLDGQGFHKSAISSVKPLSYRSKECRWTHGQQHAMKPQEKDDKPVKKIPMSSLMNRKLGNCPTDAKAPLPPVESKPDMQLLGTPIYDIRTPT